MISGKQLCGDDDLRSIAETIFKHGGYCAEHPLAHNIL